MNLLFVSARSASVLLDESGDYYLPFNADLFLQEGAGEEIPLGSENRSVISLFDLSPETEYTLIMRRPERTDEILPFVTASEVCTLNVRRFGAQGNGEADDTPALQAAILCCPDGGRVLIPEGNYVTGPLFLRSHITLELQKGATLSLLTDPNRFPILPGVTWPTGDGEDYLLGSFEGNPLDTFASALSGIRVEDVQIIGEGVVDGRAQDGIWWKNPKEKNRGARRGNLFFLKDSRNITVQGITFRNSPCWNVHPTFSDNLSFLNITVEAPAVSPNTDGFDPESCSDIRLLGACFSVGDDCIAIKSGKIYMGQKYHTPCKNIEIAWCAMLDGHGGVTVGSENAGGVCNVRVHNCWMRGNDRGLRIKSRRGRGKYGVLDDISFTDIRMEGVKAPLVVNCLYFCDPDGHSPYVQSLEKQPVDDTTPTLGNFIFERVHAVGCQACAGYILGLPERPVKSLLMRDCHFEFTPDAPEMIPAMADCVTPCHNRGIIARFIDSLKLENVTMKGITGPETAEQ